MRLKGVKISKEEGHLSLLLKPWAKLSLTVYPPYFQPLFSESWLTLSETRPLFWPEMLHAWPLLLFHAEHPNSFRRLSYEVPGGHGEMR